MSCSEKYIGKRWTRKGQKVKFINENFKYRFINILR